MPEYSRRQVRRLKLACHRIPGWQKIGEIEHADMQRVCHERSGASFTTEGLIDEVQKCARSRIEWVVTNRTAKALPLSKQIRYHH